MPVYTRSGASASTRTLIGTFFRIREGVLAGVRCRDEESRSGIESQLFVPKQEIESLRDRIMFISYGAYFAAEGTCFRIAIRQSEIDNSDLQGSPGGKSACDGHPRLNFQKRNIYTHMLLMVRECTYFTVTFTSG